ncbi:UbiH/UbiF/VisC/COQ6 family ubiquinone biosynthesis hydroxylase [Thalassospira sp. TSL5-1]|uniref:UbiH/UbiF/VisC/COQ6 family ubiquinone biosynthesis hydroxylase n=1 Tax=Thalassospira sp. TSL5-1 TaxID=1544451 RepID=UPI00093E2415|nr:UbiH/UbiF/VisC/COQ6 family ubiquinone biosynthesis hydroxylase [Thalassospira sp. TSL5-1]OKH87584.1 2-octaprenyl-6-methoxyphenyl hydroxylase [Thalassospira sp. TSL5-1]
MTDSGILHFDAIILGGGLAGASMAMALAHGGLRSVVIDREDPKTLLAANHDGRTCAIAAASRAVLDVTGVWQYMRDEAEPIIDIRIADGKSPLYLHYDHRDVGSEALGYIVENRVTRQALYRAMAESDLVTLMAPASVAGISRNSAAMVMTLEDGRVISAPLAIGAEGRKSLLRQWAGIKTYSWSYKQSAIVCTVKHERPHHGVAVEHFLPAGPFAILPMTDNRSSIVWTEETAFANYMVGQSDDVFLDELHQRFDGYLGDLEVIGPRFCYPLGLQHAYQYSDARIALIGDAAHGMHPIAGQGLNMGIRDVAALAEILVNARRLGRDIGMQDVLGDYEQWRRFDNTVMLAVTDATNRLFSNDVAPIRMARDAGLAVVDKIPALKRTFMSHAMGYAGTLPLLMQGKPI